MPTDDLELDETALFPDESAHYSRLPRDGRRRRQPRGEEPSRDPATPLFDRQAIIALSILAAVLAAPASASPNGYVVGDVVIRMGLAALVTLATARARRWAWLWVGGVAALAASRAVAVAPAAVAVAGGFIAVVVDTHRRLWGALVGALAAQALVRLPETEWYGLQTALVLTAVVPVLVSAYRTSPRRVRHRVHLGLLGIAVLAVLGGLVLGTLIWLTAGDLEGAVASARTGLEAARDGDDDVAAAEFRRAADEFNRAEGLAGSWWMTPARVVPGLSQHALAYETAASQGARLTESGAVVAETVDVDALRYESGRLNLDLVEAAQGPLAENADALAEASEALADVDYSWLVGPLGSRLDRFRQEVDDTLPSASLAADLTEIAPGLLGADGTRRYFVIFTQPAEARGLGGFMGSWAELTAIDGDLELTDSGRTEEIRDTPGYDERQITSPIDYVRRYGPSEPWKVLQDVTLSPDYPSVAEVMGQVVPQTGHEPIDGVIAVDPYGLAALMRFTGPIRVEGLDRELTADDAADFLLREQYLEFQEDETARRDWLEDAGRETFQLLTEGDLPSPREVSEELHGVVEEGRLLLWSAHDREQEVFEEVGIDGAMPQADGHDLLAVVTQNNANNKIDIFLERSITYEAKVDPATGEVEATATVELTNTVPTLDLPGAVVANNDQGYPLGTNRVWLNLYTPLQLVEARVDGERVGVGSGRELGVWVYDGFFNIGPGETRVVEFDVAGSVAAGDTYELVFGNQPLVNDDSVSVRVTPAPGWRVVDGRGLAPSLNGERGDQLWRAERDRRLVLEFERR